MAGGFGQYLRDTRTELRHVAWPTRLQTIVYSILVAGISIGVALYLGFFDFLFTTGLSKALNTLPQNTTPAAQTQPAVQATIATSTK
ncbi:MAG TPA: preprotein translocase subunit SecE [Candidatus Paceibacterota bacterium]|nr:preprotein translocase subunit SecE [Candidatus Paceibacterota bacterium]